MREILLCVLNHIAVMLYELLLNYMYATSQMLTLLERWSKILLLDMFTISFSK